MDEKHSKKTHRSKKTAEKKEHKHKNSHEHDKAEKPKHKHEEPSVHHGDVAKPHFQVVEEVETVETQTFDSPDPDAFPPTEGLEEDSNQEPMQQEEQYPPQSDQNVGGADNPSGIAEDFSPAGSVSQHDFSSSRRGKRKFPLWAIGGAIGLVVVAVIIWRVAAGRSDESQEEPQVTDILLESTSPDSQPQEEEEEKPAKDLDREDFKVQVLNGSGIGGVAGKLAAILEGAGFEDVDTDNADAYDYNGVVVQVKDGQDDLGDLIEKDLEDDYEDVRVRDNLDDDSDFDAVLILGSQPDDEEAEDEEVLGASDEVDAATDTESTESATPE